MRIVWNLEGIVPMFTADEILISLLWRFDLRGAYRICFLIFHQLVWLCAQYACWGPDKFIAARCRMCALYLWNILMQRMSMASTPKPHHMMTLKRLFCGWSTPLREVANSAIVELGFVWFVEVVLVGTMEAARAKSCGTRCRKAVFGLIVGMVSAKECSVYVDMYGLETCRSCM